MNKLISPQLFVIIKRHLVGFISKSPETCPQNPEESATGFLYYMNIFLLGESMIKSGSARTLYLDDELWNRLSQLVKSGYARNVSQLVNRLLADALDVVAKSGDALKNLIMTCLERSI